MKPSGGDREQAKAIFSGQCDVALGNTYYVALMAASDKQPEQKEWAGAIKVLFPNAEAQGTHVNISGVMLAKNAPHKDNALKLIEYLVSAAAQGQYAALNNEYPLRADVPLAPVVQSWGDAQSRQAAARRHRQIPQTRVRACGRSGVRSRPEIVNKQMCMDNGSPNRSIVTMMRRDSLCRKVPQS